jgi:predicted nucleic-acid-binding Zn-ribbon protein
MNMNNCPKCGSKDLDQGEIQIGNLLKNYMVLV